MEKGKYTVAHYEQGMDEIIEKLGYAELNSKEYDKLISDLRYNEARIAALTARKPNFTSGINEYSTTNL